MPSPRHPPGASRLCPGSAAGRLPGRAAGGDGHPAAPAGGSYRPPQRTDPGGRPPGEGGRAHVPRSRNRHRSDAPPPAADPGPAPHPDDRVRARLRRRAPLSGAGPRSGAGRGGRARSGPGRGRPPTVRLYRQARAEPRPRGSHRSHDEAHPGRPVGDHAGQRGRSAPGSRSGVPARFPRRGPAHPLLPRSGPGGVRRHRDAPLRRRVRLAGAIDRSAPGPRRPSAQPARLRGLSAGVGAQRSGAAGRPPARPEAGRAPGAARGARLGPLPAAQAGMEPLPRGRRRRDGSERLPPGGGRGGRAHRPRLCASAQAGPVPVGGDPGRGHPRAAHRLQEAALSDRVLPEPVRGRPRERLHPSAEAVAGRPRRLQRPPGPAA